jgi:hypothetical protein
VSTSKSLTCKLEDNLWSIGLCTGEGVIERIRFATQIEKMTSIAYIDGVIALHLLGHSNDNLEDKKHIFAETAVSFMEKHKSKIVSSE